MSTAWEKKKIGEICRTGAGGTPLKSKSEYYENGEIPWLQSGEVSSRDIKGTRKTITRLGLENSSAKVFPVNTVLVAMYGATAGQVGILRSEAATNQAVCGIFPNDKLLPEYLYYALLHKKAELVATAAGNAQPNISQVKIKNTAIPLPSLPEQKHMVAILDETFAGIDTAIANTEKNLANARELFQSYLNAVFSQRGEGWHIKPVGEFAENCLGKMLDKQKNKGEMRPYLRNVNVRWFNVRTDDVLEMRIEEHEKQRFAVKAGDLLICEGGYPGRAAIWDGSEPIFFQKALHRVRCNDPRYNRWLMYYLYFTDANGELAQHFTGAGIQHFTGKALNAFTVPVPPSFLVEKLLAGIEAVYDEVMSLEVIYQKKLTALAELKQSLLQKAFAGELTSDNVVPITPAKESNATPTPDSPAFAAHIMAVAFHWHESRGKNKTFGHVKAQKTLHLVEALAQIDLGRAPIKDAAGPNDFAHMRMAEQWAREHDYYDFVQRSEGQLGYDFVKGKRYSEWLARGLGAVEPYKSALDRVVNLLMPLDTQKAELVATVYAAWNNLLLDGRKPSEADIVYEARDNWHPDKQQYSQQQFREAIDRLRNHGMVPTGAGKRVTGQESFEL